MRCEALFALRVEPWAPLEGISDATLTGLLERSRRDLQIGLETAGRLPKRIYGARRCPRCGGRVRRRGQGDENRTVHWCPACQVNCT